MTKIPQNQKKLNSYLKVVILMNHKKNNLFFGYLITKKNTLLSKRV